MVLFVPWADINNDASLQHLQDAPDGSLRRLKLEQIALYQLHRIDLKVPVCRLFYKRKLAAQYIRHGINAIENGIVV